MNQLIMTTTDTTRNHVGRTCKTLPIADGWLQAPDEREVKRYHRDQISCWYVKWALIDHGLPIPTPALLMRRRRVPGDAALIEWKGLKKISWRRVSPQW